MNPNAVPLTLAQLEQQMFLRHQQQQQQQPVPSSSRSFDSSLNPPRHVLPQQPSSYTLPPPTIAEAATAPKPTNKPEEVVLIGTIDVRPNVTGPDEFIEVAWSVPKSCGNNTPDWIGLFRSRQKLQDNTNYILNRDTAQRTQFDPKSQCYRGKVRLRTPKGVGQYDFRFFSNNSVVPIARSSAVTVEVQGTALLEALDFISKNAKDKKRLAAAAAQLASLVRQIRTLKGGNKAKLQQQQQGGVVMVERPEQQEQRVLDELWRVIYTICTTGAELAVALMDQCVEWQKKCAEAKLELADHAHIDDLEDHQEESPASAAAAATQDDAKKQEWIALMNSLSHAQRERTSVASSIFQVLEEVMFNTHIQLSRERLEMVQDLLLRYCPIDEHFFSSQEELQVHMLCDYQLLNFTSSRRMLRVPSADEWNYYLHQLVTRELSVGLEFYDQRRQIIFRLQQLINEMFPRTVMAKLSPFGSSANSFGGPNSDLDLCLVFDKPLKQDGAVQVVETIAQVLNKLPNEFTDVDDTRKTARIPIVKFISRSGIECDICVNNPLAMRNTLLLRTYGSIDARVGHMVSLVKHWSKRRNINDPSSHTLSSYGWILLTINFLQRVELLPVLQNMPVNLHGAPFFPNVMTPGTDGKHLHETYFFGDPESPYFRTAEAKEQAAVEARRLSTQCNKTVVELLAAFWWDLAMGDWRRNVVSVRQGDFILKSVKAAEDAWRLHGRVSIEDPFETSYDVGHVLRDGPFRRMRKEALRAYGLLTASLDGYETRSVLERMDLLFQRVEVEVKPVKEEA